MTPRKQYSDEEVGRIINKEGFGYALLKYTSSDRIANPKLRAAWERAKAALEELAAMLPEGWEE
jgi:hypothetical protein